ncbi:GNAT family N-acetyltransferase [Streptomyces sp. W16]|uniref:GNAT family N-acetyltransferase n=1 Tax=Streptomyces sp. W16 TaxID=3076631 RepID=UPI00295A69A9|nr:GNAT family N-acetyltransferase [Streptomyces sp. W16]MDV9168924.1 GNAT family N-acetyltransferase [Streptomyces sp. W16]
MTAFQEERSPSPGRRADRAFLADRGDRHLTLRGITEADLPELLRVDREAFPEEPYPVFVLRQLYDIHGDRVLVLDDGERLLGYILFVNTSDGYLSWIMSLAVTPRQQGHGLGRRLMVEALRRLRAERVHQVRLTVEPTNAAAIMLYRSLGFSSEEGVQRDYFGPDEHRLLMTLAL